MITKNFKTILANIFTMSSDSSLNKGMLPIKSVDGVTRYLSPTNSGTFPANISKSIYINTPGIYIMGIFIGSGTTPATENDYTVESPIGSGLTASSPASAFSLDENGNPTLSYTFTLTNTSNNAITVSEFCYIQRASVSDTQGGTSNSGIAVLLDRTLLDSPVEIPAGEYAAFKYSLKTVLPTP